MNRASSILICALIASATTAAAQTDVRARLAARGVSDELAQGVATVAADATAQNLPVNPLVDKALEGWAKHAPSDRILVAVRQMMERMSQAREVERAAGLASPPADVIAAGAEALGRGMQADQVRTIVLADHATTTAVGLRVASALAAQGMGMNDAVAVVTRSMRARQRPQEILNLPSTMRALQAQGLSAPEIGRHFLRDGAEGGEHPVTGQPLPPGAGVRPPRELPSPGKRDGHN